MRFFQVRQSIGVSPRLSKKRLHFEKCLHPKNPLYAESGEGCTLSRTKCCGLVMSAFLLRAFPPQSIKTIGSFRSFRCLIMLSVSCSQPLPLCELASPERTVKTVFKRSTPCSAHGMRYGEVFLMPTSLSISLKMLTSEGGASTPGLTEKLIPCACPSP